MKSITYNTRDFASVNKFGIKVMTAKEFSNKNQGYPKRTTSQIIA